MARVQRFALNLFDVDEPMKFSKKLPAYRFYRECRHSIDTQPEFSEEELIKVIKQTAKSQKGNRGVFRSVSWDRPKILEYDENIDITSVMIPISRKYLRYSYKAMDLAAKDQNLDFGREKIKINSVDAIGIINRSTYSNSIRKTLTAIFDRFFNEEFSRADIVSYLNASKSAGTNYISYLQKLNVVEQVKGKGKGKYRFR